MDSSRNRLDDSSHGAAPRGELSISADDLAAAAGITMRTLARLVALDLIEPLTPGSNEFTVAMAARLRRMIRLHANLGVNLMGAAIIVDLVERLERLERERARGNG